MRRVNYFKKSLIIFLGFILFMSIAVAPVLSASSGNVTVSATVATSGDDDEDEGGGGGGGGGGDIIPPEIYDVNPEAVHPEPGEGATEEITWSTNEVTTSKIEYGLTEAYELGEIYEPADEWILNHRLKLKFLEPNKTYHFKITARDAAGNETYSEDFTFVTVAPEDLIAPPNVKDFWAAAGDAHITLTWRTPKDPSYDGVLIKRSTIIYPNSVREGQTIYQGKGSSHIDLNLINGIRYYYTAFAYDIAGNVASGAIASAVPQKAPIPSLKPIDEDIPSLDEDKPPIIIPTEEEKRLEKLSPKYHLELSDFTFIAFTDMGPLQIFGNEISEFNIVKGTELMVTIPQVVVARPIKVMTVTIGNSSYLLGPDTSNEFYQAKFTVPEVKGKYSLFIIIAYQDGSIETITANMLVDPYGYVYAQGIKSLGQGELRIEGAQVTLFHFNNQSGEWEFWPGEKFNQKNPQTTTGNGEYAFLVPKGKYYIVVERDGYRKIQSKEVVVKNNIVNLNIELSSWRQFFWSRFGQYKLLIILGGLAIILFVGWLIVKVFKGKKWY